MSVFDTFWSHVKVGAEDECWPWLRGKCDGYGWVRTPDGNKYASAVAWRLTHGEPKGYAYVLHTCDNSACCNPKHLFLGTHLDNVADREKKNRQPSGEWAATAKLSNEQAKLCRHLYWAERRTYRELGEFFGIGVQSLNNIIHRRTYVRPYCVSAA